MDHDADSPLPISSLSREDMVKVINFMVTVRQIHHILLKFKGEADLYQRICQKLMTLQDVAFVWLGLVEDPIFEIKPTAQAGLDAARFAATKLRMDDWSGDLGPAGTALQIRQPVLIREMPDSPVAPCVMEAPTLMGMVLERKPETDPFFPIWHETKKPPYRAVIALPLQAGDRIIGVLNLYSYRKDAFNNPLFAILTEAADDLAFAVHSLRLENKLEHSYRELNDLFNQTVVSISMLHEFRDEFTSKHQQRVTDLACAIAAKMGRSDFELRGITILCRLHDLGTILLPAELIAKPEPLSPSELALVKTHPATGCNILKGIHFPWPVCTAILQHHERLDGSGYPNGLTGDEIIWEAKLLAVADVVEAMSSPRPYRPARDLEQALTEINAKKGTQFDPDIVDVCTELFRSGKFQFAD